MTALWTRTTSSNVVTCLKSPGLISEIRTALGYAAQPEPMTADEACGVLAAGPCHLVYELGVWRHAASSDVLGALALSPESRVFLVWRGDSQSAGEAVRFASVAPRAALGLEAEGIGALLRRWMGTPHDCDVAVRAIRTARELDPAVRISPAFVAALALGGRRRSVDDLSGLLSTSHRSLRRHCADAGLPRPAALLGWCRSFHVVTGLERGDGTLQDIAAAGGDDGARACCDYVRYHTGRTPAQWHHNGGLRAAIEAFLARRASPAPFLS
jgi:hypothetical protein